MKALDYLKQFWEFLKKDTWQSWLVSLGLAFVFIKFIFFPLLSFAFATPLPLVVVESCSMYHTTTDLENWWDSNSLWYLRRGITLQEFKEFPFKSGLNKGDIILVSGRGEREVGDIIIFNSEFQYPLIHRVVDDNPLETKGDNNFDQLPQERRIKEEDVLGKSILRIPGLGWVKLIFFEAFKEPGERGFCE